MRTYIAYFMGTLSPICKVILSTIESLKDLCDEVQHEILLLKAANIFAMKYIIQKHSLRGNKIFVMKSNIKYFLERRQGSSP